MPKLSAEKMARRSHDILTAAARCFRKRGFHATTIADICREAQISAGAVYIHFDGKHQIVEKLGRESQQDLARALASLPSTGSTVLALAQLLRRLFKTQQGLADAELDLNLWAEAIADLGLRKVCRSSFHTMEQVYISLLKDLHKDATQGLARILLAASIGFEVQRALGVKQDLNEIQIALEQLLQPPKQDSNA